MKNELSTKQFCIKLSDGTIIYIDEDKAKTIKSILQSGDKPFIEVNGELINTRYIQGILDAKTVEVELRRKQGQWKCEYGTWHEKGQECGCAIAKQYGL